MTKKEFVILKLTNKKTNEMTFDVCTITTFKDYVKNCIDHENQTYFAIPCTFKKLHKFLSTTKLKYNQKEIKPVAIPAL